MKWFKRKKDYVKNVEQNANEKVLVLYFGDDHGLVCDTWTLEALWNYMKETYKTGLDPYDLMHISQNEYALGKAEVWGMRRERKDKYGR